MEGRAKLHMEKNRENINDWNFLWKLYAYITSGRKF
jgi:hypothetical protein